MLDVTLLGCGGTMPLPVRWLTSLYVRCNGHGILIDCGEGTQIALKEAGLSAHDIDLILLTHFHGDHVMGLPGILMSMGMSGRTEPVTVAGPKNLTQVVPSLCAVAGIPFDLKGIEITEPECEFVTEFEPSLTVQAFQAWHSVTTYGYSLVLNRLPKFDREKAEKNGVPIKYWSRLQKGNTIEEEGRIYTPDLVLGSARKGIRLTCCTDTRPTERIVRYCRDADLAVLEGMYGSDERLEAAKVKKHMVFSEAAEIAAKANVKELWLTHYSPSETHPEQWIDHAREIFPQSHCGTCGKHTTLTFTDE